MKEKTKFTFLVKAGLLLAFMAAGCAESADGTKYKTYTDGKFGCSAEYPDIFDSAEQYEDGDGNSNFVLTVGEGAYDLSVVSGKNTGMADGNALLKEAVNTEEDEFGYVYGVEALPGTAKSGADFYTLKYITDRTGPESVVHVYGVANKNVKAVFEFRYPQDEEERFAEIIARMEKSFRLTSSN